MEILDRVGGGDSFASGLIYGLLQGYDLSLAVEYGAAHGALAEELASLDDGPSLRRGQGVLRVAMDAKGRDALGQKATNHPEWLGTWMDAARVVELEPALEGTPILGAFVTEQGFMVDTEAYLNALLHDLHRKGVRVRLGEGARAVTEVDGGVEVRTENETHRAGRLVVCAGAWSGASPPA